MSKKISTILISVVTILLVVSIILFVVIFVKMQGDSDEYKKSHPKDVYISGIERIDSYFNLDFVEVFEDSNDIKCIVEKANEIMLDKEHSAKLINIALTVEEQNTDYYFSNIVLEYYVSGFATNEPPSIQCLSLFVPNKECVFSFEIVHAKENQKKYVDELIPLEVQDGKFIDFEVNNLLIEGLMKDMDDNRIVVSYNSKTT